MLVSRQRQRLPLAKLMGLSCHPCAGWIWRWRNAQAATSSVGWWSESSRWVARTGVGATLPAVVVLLPGNGCGGAAARQRQKTCVHACVRACVRVLRAQNPASLALPGDATRALQPLSTGCCCCSAWCTNLPPPAAALHCYHCRDDAPTATCVTAGPDPTQLKPLLSAPLADVQFTEDPHWVMCALVVVNAACNTALPLFIDRWVGVPPWEGVRRR